MNDRTNIINKLLNLSDDLKIIEGKLSKFDWDYQGKGILLKKEHLLRLFNKYLNNLLDYKYMSRWADIIELRDDIYYEKSYENIISEVISFLSMPEINGKLTNEEIKKYIERLSNRV